MLGWHFEQEGLLPPVDAQIFLPDGRFGRVLHAGWETGPGINYPLVEIEFQDGSIESFNAYDIEGWYEEGVEWGQSGPRAYSVFASDYVASHQGHAGTMECPACGENIAGQQTNLRPMHDFEGDVTHWEGTCPKCGVSLTVFND